MRLMPGSFHGLLGCVGGSGLDVGVCRCNPSVTNLVVNRRFWIKRKANSGEAVVPSNYFEGREREKFWGIFKASNPIQLHLAIPENVLLKLKNSENADAEYTTMCPEIAPLQHSILVLTPVGLHPNFVLEKVKTLRKKIRFTGNLK